MANPSIATNEIADNASRDIIRVVTIFSLFETPGGVIGVNGVNRVNDFLISRERGVRG